MSERFFLATPPQDSRAILEADEARHCGRVLRAQPGDTIRVFDGRGGEWPARIATIARDVVTLDLGDPLPAPAAPGAQFVLAAALPKGDRQKWMVEKLTELGVARLVPLVTERGVAEATDAARARLERGVIEACKQCGRNRLMEIGAAVTLRRLAEDHPAAIRLIAHPDGIPLNTVPISEASTDIVAAVGPEGGFTTDELADAQAAGFTRVSLGPLVLRIETAAIALAACALERGVG